MVRGHHQSQTPNSSELGAFFSASLANPCEKVRVNAKTCGPRGLIEFWPIWAQSYAFTRFI